MVWNEKKYDYPDGSDLDDNTLTASDYNDLVEFITTLGASFDHHVNYVLPSVSISGGSTYEIGSTITNATLHWTLNKDMVSVLLSAPVPSGDRNQTENGTNTYIHSNANIVSNTTYSVTVNDGENSASSSTTFSFANRRYYGVSSNASLTNAQVLALTAEFCTARSNTHTYDCTGGAYIWICYPKSYGTATFNVGGLEVVFNCTEQSVTNASGHTETFYCYRSLNALNGSGIQVIVS